MHQAILLPGGVLPKELAYGPLVEALGEDVRALPKDLDLYSTDAPPPGYGLELELEGVSQEADAAGFERFHLAGYSGGGAAALAFASRHPDRVLSLALLEPAWMGNEELSDDERALWGDLERIAAFPPERLMPEFVRASLAPGVEPPPPPAGPPPPWMAKRPAGIKALIAAFTAFELELDALRSFPSPSTTPSAGSATPATTARWPSTRARSSATSRSTYSRSATTSIRRTAPSLSALPDG